MPTRVRLTLLLAGALVLALIIRAMGAGRILSLVARSGWTFAWMVGLYALHIALRGWIIWRNLPAGRVPLSAAVRIRFAAESVEMLTFTGPFLAEPAKGWMFVRRGIDAATIAGVIAFEYLTYTVMAADLALAGLAVLLRRGVLPAAVRAPVGVLVGVLAAFTLAFAFAAISRIGLLAPAIRLARPLIGGRRAGAAAAQVAAMETTLLALLHDRPARLVEALTAQLAGHAMLAAEIWILLRALGYPVNAADPWVIEGGVKFINTAFVFVPGQLGAAEGVNALLVSALGYPAAVGVTLSLLRRARAYLVAAAGLVVSPS